MSVPDAKRLKELEAEGTRLQELLAEQVFQHVVINDALRKKLWPRRLQAAGAKHDRGRPKASGERLLPCG